VAAGWLALVAGAVGATVFVVRGAGSGALALHVPVAVVLFVCAVFLWHRARTSGIVYNTRTVVLRGWFRTQQYDWREFYWITPHFWTVEFLRPNDRRVVIATVGLLYDRSTDAALERLMPFLKAANSRVAPAPTDGSGGR
jgi:hypothetical protein